MFRSAPPCEGATQRCAELIQVRPVSIRAPRARGRPEWVNAVGRGVGFDPRPRARGRLAYGKLVVGDWRFDPRPRARGRLMPWNCVSTRTGFDPRPRARGRRGASSSAAQTQAFRSAPPCEGATRCRGRCDGSGPVSIRAPVRGGDDMAIRFARYSGVSIRAPVRGGDAASDDASSPTGCFDPRPRARGRHLTYPGLAYLISVSIRAPVRGGDVPILWGNGLIAGFDPRPRARGRLAPDPFGLRAGGFDPRPRARGRRSDRPTSRMLPCFDPRPRARGRLCCRCAATAAEIVSIRAPVRGGDAAVQNSASQPSGFDPRPRARGRHRRPAPRHPCRRFDPRPRARGRRGAGALAWRHGTVSIRAPVRGGDVCFLENGEGEGSFRSAPPCEGATTVSVVTVAARGCFDPRPRARGRRQPRIAPDRLVVFRSAPPCEGATGDQGSGLAGVGVSIRAPVRGGDQRVQQAILRHPVSIRAPVRGGDLTGPTPVHTCPSFDPRPRARGRLPVISRDARIDQFRSAPPCEGATCFS